jgi:hypothetical protein
LRRPASPAPDGPGDHDHAPIPLLLAAPPARRPGYFDDGLGRAGWDPEDRCPVDELCALVKDHGGGCDPRPEPERCASLRRVLDRLEREGREDDDEALSEAVEREAADALRRARS